MDVRSAQPKLRPIIAGAALLGLTLTFASWPAIAQQWTPQQRAACEPDAMRLCQQYVSDIGRVRVCMSRGSDGRAQRYPDHCAVQRAGL